MTAAQVAVAALTGVLIVCGTVLIGWGRPPPTR